MKINSRVSLSLFPHIIVWCSCFSVRHPSASSFSSASVTHTQKKKCHRQLDHTQLHRRQHLSIQTLSHITCQHTTLSHTQHCHTHTHQHCHTQLCHTHKAKLSHKTLFVTQPHSRAQICHTQVSSSFCVACMALAAVVWLGWTALVTKTPLCVTGRRGSCGTGPFWYNIVAYNFVTHNSVSYSFCGHHCVTHTTMSLMTCSQNSVTVTFPHNSVAHNWCYACIVLCNQYRSFSVTPFCYRSVSDLLLPSSCLPILIFPIYSVLVGKKLTCGVIWSFNLIKVFRIGTPFCQCFLMWTNHLRWILALRALCATHK